MVEVRAFSSGDSAATVTALQSGRSPHGGGQRHVPVSVVAAFDVFVAAAVAAVFVAVDTVAVFGFWRPASFAEWLLASVPACFRLFVTSAGRSPNRCRRPTLISIPSPSSFASRHRTTT